MVFFPPSRLCREYRPHTASADAVRPAFAIGDIVSLSRSYLHSVLVPSSDSDRPPLDAIVRDIVRSGPLTPSTTGTITLVDTDDARLPYKVKTASGALAWYPGQALVPAASGGAGTLAARLHVASSTRFRPSPNPTQRMPPFFLKQTSCARVIPIQLSPRLVRCRWLWATLLC